MLTEEQQEVVESAAEVSFALRTLRCAVHCDSIDRFDSIDVAQRVAAAMCCTG
jgi:hypothetical protein